MKNRIGYFFLILCFIGIFLIFQSFGILVILGFLVLLPLISYGLCRIAFRHLFFEIHTTGEIMEKKQEFPVRIIVRNSSYIPMLQCFLEIYVQNEFASQVEKTELDFAVPALGETRKELCLSSDYCGRVSISIKKAGVYDFLGLFFMKKEDLGKNEVMVFPERKEAVKLDTNVYVSGHDDVEESQTKGSDFSEVSEIREYIPGDSLKDIHWKLSAKTEELMVKEHVSLSSRQIAILLELYNDEFCYIDGVLDYAYSVFSHLIEKRRAFTLYWWSEISGIIKEKVLVTKEDLEECLREIFYEKTYEVSGKGQTQFSYTLHHLEYLVVIDNKERFSYVAQE